MGTTYGYPNDVNNTISLRSAYPGGRSYGMTAPAATRYNYRQNAAGQLSTVNQTGTAQQVMRDDSSDVMPQESNGLMGKPSHWWISFLLVFGVFYFVAKKYSSQEDTQFSNLRLTLFNGIFLTIFIVLILSFLKVLAAKVKIPGFSELILAI